MKICKKCNQWLDDDCFLSFKRNNKEYKYGKCKSCYNTANIQRATIRGDEFKEYQRNYHKTVKSKRRKEIREENLKKVRSLKEQSPCADCKVSYPHYVMDFDHLRDKVESVGSMLSSTNGWETIKLEIAKCELLCSNCHRKRTWLRAHEKEICEF